MNVNITILPGATVVVTDINFGAQPSTNLSASVTSNALQGGLMTWTCSPGGPTPALTGGAGGNFSLGSNRMKGSASTPGYLPYSLNLPTLGSCNGLAQLGQITATIPAQTNLPAADVYTDAVVLTLTY